MSAHLTLEDVVTLKETAYVFFHLSFLISSSTDQLGREREGGCLCGHLPSLIPRMPQIYPLGP
jgi:hypothetical protein